MSLQDRLSSADASQLLMVASAISLWGAATTAPRYNFTLMCFGIVAHELRSSTVAFRQFLLLLLGSAFFDIYHLMGRTMSLSILIPVATLLLKIPIFFACLAQLRERGGDLQVGGQSLGNLPTSHNWSMPGGFGGGGLSSQGPAPPPPQPASFPSSGGFRLGGEEDEADETDNKTSGGPASGPSPGRNGYQTIG